MKQKILKDLSFHWRAISIFLACFLWPCLGFADDLMGAISSEDYSIRFLSNIFGVVDGVLHGSGSQIFGIMFGVFNSAVLTLGTTILGYTLFVSTLRTAHEGEALGRNWSSMWIPFKSATGFALMLPKASGYSLIQIFVMWTVVQGVGAANLLWNAALDYLGSGGAIIQPQTPSLSGSVGLSGQILRSEVCMFMLEQALTNQQQNSTPSNGTPAPVIPSFLQTVTSTTPQNQPDYQSVPPADPITAPKIYFPGVLTNSDGSPFAENQYKGVCGTVSWSSSKVLGAQQLSDARSLAVLQIIADLAPYAQQIATDYGPSPNATKTCLDPKSKIPISQTILLDAANDYEGIVGPAVNLMQAYRTGVQGAGLNGFTDEAKNEGWIMAGSYYQSLIALNRDYATDENAYPSSSFTYPPSTDTVSLPTAMAQEGQYLSTFFGTTQDSPLNQYINNQLQGTGSSNGPGKQFAIGSFDVVGGIAGQFTSLLFGITTIIQGYAELWANTGLPTTGANNAISVFNPVTSLATLGEGLVGFVISMWIMGAVAVFGTTALTDFCPAFNPIGKAIGNFLQWFMPMLTILMVLLLTVGATLAYYIPMVPYILFLFGGIGWIIGVIESIVAAPLVALGIAYPEEHEVLGKAQPAVMLLTNIFLRPSLMVIGFIAGISLSFVGVWLLNAGFGRATLAMLAAAQGFGWLFIPIAMMSIYTALVVQIINQAFGLIHAIPDEVLRWIGGGGKNFGESTSEQAVRGSIKGDTDSLGKGMAGTTERAHDLKGKGKKGGAGGRPGGGGGISSSH